MRGLPSAQRFPHVLIQGCTVQSPSVLPGESRGREDLGVTGGSSVTEVGVLALIGVQVRTLSSNEKNPPQTMGLPRAPALLLALGGWTQG